MGEKLSNQPKSTCTVRIAVTLYMNGRIQAVYTETMGMFTSLSEMMSDVSNGFKVVLNSTYPTSLLGYVAGDT